MTATQRYEKKLAAYRASLQLRPIDPSQPPPVFPRVKPNVRITDEVSVTILIGRGYHALIDLADLDLVCGYRWRPRIDKNSNTVYASAHMPGSGHRGKDISMHRLVMDAKPGERIDHRAGDGLDNRRSNLRRCSNAQNIRNSQTYSRKATAKLKGVYFDKSAGKYRAQIMCQYKKINLGNFNDEESAGRAYDTAARKLFGEFARLNFPQEAQA